MYLNSNVASAGRVKIHKYHAILVIHHKVFYQLECSYYHGSMHAHAVVVGHFAAIIMDALESY